MADRLSPLYWSVDSGTEIRLFDPLRKPTDWTGLVHPTQCVVFLKDQATFEARTLHGMPFSNPDDATCVVFDRLDNAISFCEDKVQAFPDLRCLIYNAQGPAGSPLLEIVHPDNQKKAQSGFFSPQRRKLAAAALVLVAVLLIWMDVRRGNTLILPTFLAINCIITALRLLYWDFGMKHTEKVRAMRLEEHRKMEQGL